MKVKYKEEKDKLLVSLVIVIIYLITKTLRAFTYNSFLSKDNFTNFLDIIEIIFSLLGCIYFIYLIKKKDIELKKHKVPILLVSIFFFLVNIISGVIGFMVYNKIKSKKRDLPVLKNIKEHKSLVYILSLIISTLLLFYVPNLIKGKIIYIVVYLPIILIMTFTFKEELKSSFKEFKKYFKEYNSLVLKTWLKALITLIILNVFIQIITHLSSATNQENLQIMFNKNPLIVILLTTLYAPISEELMFRGVFRKIINNKWAFILISGILFGLAHVIDDFKSIEELLYILVYSSLGCYLAWLYYKTNNIFTNIYFHFLQNSFSVIGMLILYFIK